MEQRIPSRSTLSIFTALTIATAALSAPSAAQQSTFTLDGRGCPNDPIDLRAGNDTISAPLALGFSFPFRTGPNGSTVAIEVSSNGYVYLLPGTAPDSRPLVNLFGFAQEGPSIACLGCDLDPGGGGSVLFQTTDRVATIEWRDVPYRGQTQPNTFLCRLHASGEIELIYAELNDAPADVLVGFSPGFGATNPGPTNLSTPGSAPEQNMIYEVFGPGNGRSIRRIEKKVERWFKNPNNLRNRVCRENN